MYKFTFTRINSHLHSGKALEEVSKEAGTLNSNEKTEQTSEEKKGEIT